MPRLILTLALLVLCSTQASAQTRCADGTYVSGGCVLTPSGRYIGGGLSTNKPEITHPPRTKPAQERIDERDARQQYNDVDRDDEREGLGGTSKP